MTSAIKRGIQFGIIPFLPSLRLLLTCSALTAQNENHRVWNIVLVHGAWADGSGWKGVSDNLTANDRITNPDLERWYAARGHSHKVEVSGASHSVHISRPKEVAELIEEAAPHAQ